MRDVGRQVAKGRRHSCPADRALERQPAPDARSHIGWPAAGRTCDPRVGPHLLPQLLHSSRRALSAAAGDKDTVAAPAARRTGMQEGRRDEGRGEGRAGGSCARGRHRVPASPQFPAPAHPHHALECAHLRNSRASALPMPPLPPVMTTVSGPSGVRHSRRSPMWWCAAVKAPPSRPPATAGSHSGSRPATPARQEGNRN